MAFASTGTADLLRPTFFELVAAEALMPSLKAALAYSLWVNAQRQAWMGRALKYEHEIYAAVALFLEHQSLSGDCGSVSEAMYGLSRTPVGAAPGTRITKRQRWISILFLVAVPYMKAKLDSLFVQHGRVRTLQQTMEGTDETGESSRSPTNDLRQRLCLWLMRGFSSIYPWIHAGYEGSLLAYQVLYLVEKTQCFTPWLHILGLRIVRAPAEDQMRKKNRLRMQRWRRIQDIRGSASWSWLRVLKETLLQSGWAISDNVRTSLIMAVFAFKALEWWYTTAEERLAASQALPVPPPPPGPMPHPNGLSLPRSPELCPICRNVRSNPAHLTASGFVFCHQCIHPFVDKHGHCPVTLIPAGLGHIRRLYKGS